MGLEVRCLLQCLHIVRTRKVRCRMGLGCGVMDMGLVVIQIGGSGKEGEGRLRIVGRGSRRKDRQKINASKATLSSRHSGGNRERPDPESEWIVLDLGDDFAFKSFLRVIHRYAPHVVDSSFLSSLPEPQIPNRPSNDGYPAAPAPTPNFTTPFPSPNQSAPSTSLNQWSWNTARQEQVRRPIAEEISPIATPVVERPVSPNAGQGTSSPPSLDTVAENVSEPASSGANNTPAGTQTPVVPPRDSKLYRLPPSPTYERMRAAPSSSQTSPVMSAAFLGRRPSGPKHIQTSRQKKSLSTFGALPYPEWRLEIVTKAQRAGMGELTRAMDQFLWSDNPGLALLSREFGLSLGPMEMIRSPSIHTAAGDRFSLNGDGDSTEDATSIRKEKRRRRKMTMEQENIAMGLDLAGNAPFSGNSSKTLNEPSQQSTVSSSTGNSVSEHSLTSTLPGVSEDSRSSLKLGFVDEDSSESGEESSDAEWLGWMADLHRQARLQRVQGERNRLETESLGSETDLFDYWDYQQQDDHRRYQQERKALEPFAIVTSSSPVPTVPSTPVTSTIQGSFIASEYSHSRGLGSTASVETSNASSTSHRPATPVGHIGGPSAVLTSPSSNESLGKKQGRRLSYGLSPSDPPSSATSPSLSQIGHSVEITHHKHEHVSSRSSMHHRPISGMVRDGPHLSHYASTGLIGSGSLASARDTESTNSSLTSGRRPSMPSLSSLSSVARSDGSSSPSVVPSASATASTSSGWPPVERWGASVSLARSIVLQTSQPQPQLSEHTIRATMPRRSSITGLAINPASSSGQSLFSGEEGAASHSNASIRNKSPPVKKKSLVREKAEKLLQGLESTLDFVDAR
ncbi:hypothetical protein GYMLUDRAFT_599351 [Collybiopsis luxurians FD-317 M1]|uniref:Uncharacterized protein n=1 Tax=Collybiopsis luxurians FD-317 M1 TaxID=944289 RepID=A0A0D0CXL3_9AGAR|nr:hypothetical protein GYMLUDRAFT_599351 [Collybiopsis luxurians FD-317 M1]